MYRLALDLARGVKFCTAVHRRPGQGISHLGNPKRPKSTGESACARTELEVEPLEMHRYT